MLFSESILHVYAHPENSVDPFKSVEILGVDEEHPMKNLRKKKEELSVRRRAWRQGSCHMLFMFPNNHPYSEKTVPRF